MSLGSFFEMLQTKTEFTVIYHTTSCITQLNWPGNWLQCLQSCWCYEHMVVLSDSTPHEPKTWLVFWSAKVKTAGHMTQMLTGKGRRNLYNQSISLLHWSSSWFLVPGMSSTPFTFLVALCSTIRWNSACTNRGPTAQVAVPQTNRSLISEVVTLCLKDFRMQQCIMSWLSVFPYISTICNMSMPNSFSSCRVNPALLVPKYILHIRFKAAAPHFILGWFTSIFSQLLFPTPLL